MRVALMNCFGNAREEANLPGNFSDRRPGDVIETCTILTTEANEALAPIYPRTPVILDPDAIDVWLAGETVQLDPYPSANMAAHPVSTLVNSPKNDDQGCVEPIGER